MKTWHPHSLFFGEYDFQFPLAHWQSPQLGIAGLLHAIASVKDNCPILFGFLGDLVWVRVRGRGSFEVSPHLKQFADKQFEIGRKRFVIDLEECQLMDSTFMGTLLGIASRMEKDGVLAVVNANDRNRMLMRNLGLNLLLDLDESGEEWSEERQLVAHCLRSMDTSKDVGREETATVMLEAHEALSDLRKENRPRFRDVIDYLKDELDQES